MNFSMYVGKKVRIILNNGFTYVGIVLDFDENSITIRDIKDSIVQLKESTIELIQEGAR